MQMLPAEDRRILVALLKWSPSISQRLCNALESVMSPWIQKCTEEDYLLILHDLERSIQQSPIVWTDIAQINIRLDSIYARLQQVVPTLAVHGELRRETTAGDSASGFCLLRQGHEITIHGGSFTIYPPSANSAAHRSTHADRTSSALDVTLAPTLNVPTDRTQQALEEGTERENEPAVVDV
ncbi:hypothetical protein D9613_012402 [Agrocybe pediades]|uniref:Uncharacterized protein n=1 Tax=Agrocybe pediades TaxID=84607 RepID=A0A8H4VM41_9AGAR|nr:hypothetical protein D9613_012402 [Agrocybe pediades]